MTYTVYCKDCEYLYHCYARDVAIKISNDDTDDMVIVSGGCDNFYKAIQ